MNTHKIEDPQEQRVDDSNFVPPHPGSMIRGMLKEGFGLTVVAAAPLLGIARENLTRVLNGQAALTNDLAYKLEALTGMDADLMIGMQSAFDRHRERDLRASYRRSIKRLEPLAA